MLIYLGRFHIVLLHFPIGLIAAWGIAEILRLVGRRKADPRVEMLCKTLAWGTVSSAGIAALAGVFLAMDPKYFDAKGFLMGDVEQHRQWALFFCAMACASLVARGIVGRIGTRLFLLSFGLTLAALTIAGHLGGNLVHGSDFLSEKSPSWMARFFTANEEQADQIVQGMEKGSQDEIEAILKAKCMDCHRAGKASGSYRVDERGFFSSAW